MRRIRQLIMLVCLMLLTGCAFLDGIIDKPRVIGPEEDPVAWGALGPMPGIGVPVK